jgi:GNAT superfamily N-acetyltransferase
MTDQRPVKVRRSRIEEIRDLAAQYRAESAGPADRSPDPAIPQGGIFWIAEDHGTPVGYAAGRLRPEGLQIGPVFVLADFRRRGVGEQLLRSIQHWAGETRVPVVEVSVAAHNESGRRFLEASGYVPRRILFSPTPERPDPESAREDR